MTQVVSHTVRLILFKLIYILIAGMSVNAQVSVNTAVLPPYGSNVESYADRTRIVVTASGADLINVECYLNIRITGNNGIVLQSLIDRAYPTFNLTNAIPVILAGHDLYEYFNLQNLMVSGITLNELQLNGLPPGSYQVCARVYHEGFAWSPDFPTGCSNYFTISHLQPPVLITPSNQSEVKGSAMQSIIFSWTPSPGSPPWTNYKLTLVEIKDPNQAPGDAMLSNLPFFEAEVLGTSFFYGPAQPLLDPGVRYAFRVTASDPESGQQFLNAGHSEVFWFMVGDKEESVFEPKHIETVEISADTDAIQELKKEFELIPNTRISGRIFCKFPDMPGIDIGPVSLPSTDPIIPMSIGGQGQQTLPEDRSGTISFSDVMKVGSKVSSDVINIKSGTGGLSGVTSVADQAKVHMGARKMPYYYFGSTETLENTKPLANQRVRLVGRYAYLPMEAARGTDFPVYGDPDDNEIFYHYTDINDKERTDPYKVVNVVLAVAETDDKGNFAFDFRSDFFTGDFTTDEIVHQPIDNMKELETPMEKVGWAMQQAYPGVENNLIDEILGLGSNINAGVNAGVNAPSQQQQVMSGGVSAIKRGGYICLKIEVENEKFCSPDIDIFAMPGEVIKVPDQVAKLKTYNLEVRGIASSRETQVATPNEPMDNVLIHIMRDYSKLGEEIKMLVDYEGQRLKTKTINNNGEFKDVAMGTTGEGDNAYVFFKNLVKHAYIKPQYMISLSVRDIETVDVDYENTKYNYKTVFVGLPDNSETSATAPPPPVFGKTAHVTYNHLFSGPQTLRLKHTMVPLEPEIKGRVMAETNIQNAGIDNARVQLVNQTEYNKTFSSVAAFENEFYGSIYYSISGVAATIKREKEEYSNEIGFFRFSDLPVNLDQYKTAKGPYRRVFISNPGYKNVLLPLPGQKPLNMNWGLLADFKDINLEPENMVKGYVTDEDGNSVVAYVKTEFSPYYKTYDNVFLGKNYQFFDVPLSGLKPKITVQPKSSAYFERDTVLISIPDKPFKVVVYKKLHRPEIVVKNDKGEPVANAIVKIDKFDAVTTSSQGIARFRFASAGDQFIINITPPDGYSPVQETIEVPVTPDYKKYNYVLGNAREINGTITDKTTGTPINGAKIYSELKNTNGIALYIETESGQDGQYQLKGIPTDIKSLTVHVVKTGTNPTYAGKVHTIDFTSIVSFTKGAAYNFELERINGWNFSDLWGFPVAIEKFVVSASNPDYATIDGYFYNPPVVGGFALQQSDLKLPFKGLVIKRSANGRVEPNGSTIVLSINTIPFVINQTFAGELKNLRTYGGSSPVVIGKPLEIKKEGDFATIKGMAGLNLNSFNLAHGFSGSFYLGARNKENQVVGFSSNKMALQVKHIYNVFSLDEFLNPIPIKDYNLYGFNASSELNEKSTLVGNKITLSTILHTSIPSCKTCPDLDLKIRAGNVVITDKDVLIEDIPFSELEFDLEKWKVYGKDDWFFDINEEVIVLKKALVVTGQGIDATLKDLRIGPTAIGESEVMLSDGGLSLGGVKEITLNGNLKPLFNYDATGHYRISVVGSISEGVPAGYVSGLPAMDPKDRIEFRSIGLLSNHTNILSIGKNFRFYDIIDLNVNSIVSGNGYFDLVGQPDPDIPDFIPEVTSMRYKLSNGIIVPEMQFLKGTIQCPGNVVFDLDKNPEAQTFKQGEYTAYGNLVIAGGADGSSQEFYLRGFLTKTNENCEIKVIKVDNPDKPMFKGPNPQKMKIGSNVFDVFDGNIVTINKNKDWGILKYQAYTHSIEGLDEKGKGKSNILNFEVNGAIAVSSKNLKATNLDVGFGTMSLVYDINEASMTGYLNIKHLPLGFAVINDGTMNMRFDGNGYYFALSSQSMLIGITGQWRGGLVLGNTSKIIPEHIAHVVHGFENKYRPEFANGGKLKGIYAIGEKVIVDFSYDLIFVNASAKAGLGLFLNSDFSAGTPSFIIGGYGYADFNGSRGFDEFDVTICTAGVGLKAFYEVSGGYSKGKFVFNNCASITGYGFSEGACTAPLTAIGVDPKLEISVKADITYGSSGFKIELGTGICD